jgi:hypothetical protein
MASSRPPQPVGDDDPTRIMNRVPESDPIPNRLADRRPDVSDPSAARGADSSEVQAEKEWGRHGYHKTVEESHPYGQGRGLEQDQSRGDRMARPPSAVRASPAREAAARQQLPAARPGRLRQSPALPARIGLWIAVLLLAVAAGAAGAYLLIGAL